MSDPEAIDAALAESWSRGVFRGDAIWLRALVAARPDHPRASEVQAFARLAALLIGTREDVDWEPLRGDDAVLVLDAAARLWHVALQRRAQAAARAMAELEQALGRLGDDDPRAPAARALADIAVAECAIACGDQATARRRLWAIVRRQVPPGTAIAARLALALRTQRGDRESLAAARTSLDEAAALADAAGRPADAAVASLHAGVLAALAGDGAGALTRLERGLAGAPETEPEIRLVAAIVLAGVREGEHGLVDLGRGLATAAATGDYFGTITLLVIGSRKALALGRLADALAILDNGAAQLDAALGSGAGRPLRDERDRLRAGVEPERFAEAQRLAEAQRDRDRRG